MFYADGVHIHLIRLKRIAAWAMVLLLLTIVFLAARRWLCCCLGTAGDVYKGQYQANKKNGEGVYCFINADVYEGEFREDRMGKGWAMYVYSGHLPLAGLTSMNI